MKKAWLFILNILNKIDILGIRQILDNIKCEADDIKIKLRETNSMFDRLKLEIKLQEDKANKFKNLLIAVGDALPDMLWAKDLDGKYIYANRHIINNLLFSKSIENTLYKTDLDHSLAEKARVGDDNHTFGEICSNSDNIVITEKRPMKFLEYGKVKGENFYLEVHKNVIRDHAGNIIGTVGVGRNVTQEYNALKNALSEENISIEEYKKLLNNILDIYKFEVQ